MSHSNIDFLEQLEQIVGNRLANPVSGSYTAQLAESGTRRIAQKVGEEGLELALAAAAGSKAETIDEAADLLYHVIVLLADRQLTLGDVCEKLSERHCASTAQ